MDRARITENCEPLLTKPEFDFYVTGDAGGEVTMPDYYPEIRRVVCTTAKALPDSKFLSDGILEFGGTVAFSVLYIGDDNTLNCVNYAAEYSQSQSLPSQVTAGSIWVETAAENPQCRVLAPRRISLKARLRTRISADTAGECSLRALGADGRDAGGAGKSTLEELFETLDTVERHRAGATANVSGEIRERGCTKPVACDGDVCVSSVTAGRDMVNVKGSVYIRCIVLSNDGLYSTVTAVLPFEEDISADGAAPGDISAAWGRVASVSVASDDASDDGEIKLDAEFDIDVEWCRPIKVTVTKDVYSTEFETDTHREDFDVLSLLGCSSGALSVTGDMHRENSGEGGRDYLVFATASPVFEKAECRDSKLCLSGNCIFKAYIASDGDISVEEVTVPLKYEVPALCGCTNGEIVWRAQPSAIEVHGRLDGDRLNLSAELCIFTEAVRKYRADPVSEVIMSAPRACGAEGGCIRVCYPREGEKVWEIAKRHGAAMSELERINRISGDGVCDRTPIIIK